MPTSSSASTSATVTTSTSFELTSSHARFTSIKFTKQELVSQLVSQSVSDKSKQGSDSGPIISHFNKAHVSSGTEKSSTVISFILFAPKLLDKCLSDIGDHSNVDDRVEHPVEQGDGQSPVQPLGRQHGSVDRGVKEDEAVRGDC